KQVIVIRDDLKLGKGKLAAHVAHASLEGFRAVEAMNKEMIKRWEAQGSKKIVVRVENETALLEIYSRARSMLPCALIRDAGLTQVPEGTITAMVLGPWRSREIDEFTGELKLL
ncbi:MAG: aminoacyl-tRNA hydrolase, partial [Candidatus Micrarchaeota archaeon]